MGIAKIAKTEPKGKEERKELAVAFLVYCDGDKKKTKNGFRMFRKMITKTLGPFLKARFYIWAYKFRPNNVVFRPIRTSTRGN